MIPVKRLEIVIDAPHSHRVTELLHCHGLDGWSVIYNVTGSGERRLQHGDELTGVSSNHLIVTTTAPEDLDALLADPRKLLARTGGMCLVSDVHWLRH